MYRPLRILVLAVLLAAGAGRAYAQDNEVVEVPGGITYELIGTYDAARLNKIVTDELNDFKTTKNNVALPEAANGVKLYRVRYQTVIPERGNRPVMAAGLIAVPEVQSRAYPLVSYQHGTVFSKDEVPSIPEKSTETRLMIAQFAGHGYVVIAADYIGKGSSGEPDSYMVKESTAQACYDMLTAAQAVLDSLKIRTGGLFLSGWSQGAWSTMVFRNKLESLGIPIKAAATACTPSNLYLLANRWISNRSTLDADWIVGTAALLINSYENYYQLPGLSREAIKPTYWQTARDFYENKIGWVEASKIFPKSVKEFFQDDFSGKGSIMANRFFRQLFENQAYEWRYRTPTRFYYGKIDEVIPPFVAALPASYQEVIGGAPSKAVYAGDDADHRGTFIYGMIDQKKWFDELASK
ncbi:MAG TPA: lipase family protein [bacterium]|nr:lipase family protein [bacterium]